MFIWLKQAILPCYVDRLIAAERAWIREFELCYRVQLEEHSVHHADYSVQRVEYSVQHVQFNMKNV